MVIYADSLSVFLVEMQKQFDDLFSRADFVNVMSELGVMIVGGLNYP